MGLQDTFDHNLIEFQPVVILLCFKQNHYLN